MVVNSTNYNLSHQFSNSAQAAPRQTYQSNLPYRGYKKIDKKKAYQVDECPLEDQLEGIYITFEDKSNNVAYLDKGFNKIAVNFDGIEALCTKCRTTLPSKSKLHNHLKSGCLEMTLPFLPTQTALFIPIIASKAVHQFFGSGLVFRGWTYTTTLITLTPEHLPPDSDPESTACLDAGCEVTLVEKVWLLKRLPMQKINTMSTSLKVRGIRASKHKS